MTRRSDRDRRSSNDEDGDDRSSLSHLRHHGRTHRVKPRLVWSSLLVMMIGAVVAGCGVIGLGVVGPAWWIVGVGVVLLLLGAAIGLRGGFFYDISGGKHLGAILEDVREGTTIEGPDPRDRSGPPHVAERAAATEELVRAVRARSQPADVSTRQLCGWMSVACGVLLFIGQNAFADTAEAQAATLRVLGVGLVLVFAGMRLSAGPSRPAAALVALVAAVLLLSVALGDGQSERTTALQVAAGVLALGSGVLGAIRR